MVELSTFEELEEHVAGRDADVFIAYGANTPAKDEPCRLPRIVAADPGACVESTQSRFRVGEWSRTWSDEDYAAAVERVRAAIARGDVYQVNLVQHLSAPFSGDPRALGRALGPLHTQSLVTGDFAIVSATPELFLARRGGRIWTKPIKGTRPLGEDIEDDKDAAEHVMIVDLERNDLSRVCLPGTVHWPELMHQQELAGVTHLVSTVEGRLRPGAGLAEILHATFPGGSITGAPKLAAIDHIARFEPVGRGASMGAIGRVRANGDFDLALTIRTFAVADGWIHLWVGGGIVWDSDPDAEIEESWVKARPLLAAVGGLVPESRSGAARGGAWRFSTSSVEPTLA